MVVYSVIGTWVVVVKNPYASVTASGIVFFSEEPDQPVICKRHS